MSSDLAPRVASLLRSDLLATSRSKLVGGMRWYVLCDLSQQMSPCSHRFLDKRLRQDSSTLTPNLSAGITSSYRRFNGISVYRRGGEPVSELLVEFFSVRFNCLLAE